MAKGKGEGKKYMIDLYPLTPILSPAERGFQIL
jgi:hypothetical protein